MAGRKLVDKPAVRRARIVDFTTRHGSANVDQLAEQFNTSAETIRRDLAVLASGNKIRKVHGGARPVQRHEEGPFAERLMRNALGKKLIAEKLLEVVSPGQTLMIDTGSTTLACAESLARVSNLKIITNSTRIAATVSEGSGVPEVYLLGGLFRSDNSQSVGSIVIEQLNQYRADAAIITVGGIDEDGVMDYSYEEAQVAKAMITMSDTLIVVADQEKLHKRAPFAICPLERIDALVTDAPLPPAFADLVHKAGVNAVSGSSSHSSKTHRHG